MTVSWKPSGADPRALMRAGALRGVTLATEHLLQVSTQLAPIEEGVLTGTATASQNDAGDRIEGAVSFDTVYAVRQHEELTWRHDAGRQAKYLEQPHTAEAPTMQALIAQAIRARLT